MTDLCPLCHRRFEEPRAECPDDGTGLIEDRTGQSLGGRYTIRDLLGIGSNGVTVWEAWQEDAERRVAVKLLPLDEAGRDHFLDASGDASVLDHPNVVRLFDFNKTEDGLACGVMELIEGRPLSVELADDQAIPVDEALHIVQQVLAGLAHAHENGVLHLDVKPGNVFLVPDEGGEGPHVKLVDFGLVEPRPVTRRFAGALPASEDPPEALHYTAPELLASGRAGPQSDLYSVGALLFRLLSGRPPFPFEQATEITRGHLTHLPPSPFSIRPIGEMPSALPEILEQALDKAPARRFASAAAMREAIDAAIRGETLIDARDEATVARVSVADLMVPPDLGRSAPPPSRPTPEPPEDDPAGSNKPLIVAAIVMFLTLVAVIVWIQFGQQPAPAPTPTPTPTPGAVTPAAPVDAAPPTPDAAPAPVDARPVDAAPRPVDAAPPDAATRRAVRIDSAPDGARVLRGDDELGITPLEVALPLGNHTLRIEKAGRVARTVEVEVTPGEGAVERRVELARARSTPTNRVNPPPPPPPPPPPEPDAAPPPAPDAAAPPPPEPDAAPPPKPNGRKIQVLGDPDPAPTPAPRAAPNGGSPEIAPLGQ